jgi:hypothetical protein
MLQHTSGVSRTKEMMMSTLRSVGNALDLQVEPVSPSLFGRLLAAVRIYWSGIRGGMEAARSYQELTRQGMPHEIAIERVFDRHLGGR